MKQSTLSDYSSPAKAASTPPPVAPSGSKRRRKQNTQGTLLPASRLKRSAAKSTRRSVFDPLAGYSSSSSDDIGRIKLERKQPILVSDSSSSEEGSGGADSEADKVPIPTPAKRFEKLKAYVEPDSSEEEEVVEKVQQRKSKRHLTHAEDSDDEAAAPKRRRLTRQRKTSVTKTSGSDTDDLDDLEPERVLETRLRERNKKSTFQKNLERLKKKKQKQPLSSSSNEDEDDDDKEEEPAKPFKGAKPTHGSLFGSDEDDSNESDASSESESDFIVEDNGPVGAPLLPAEFSMETHQDLSHQFKKIFQFFVHIAVRPPKKRKKFMESRMEDEEYFSVPLMVTRRKLAGLRDSLVASSVWRPSFKKALETYPEISLTSLEFAIPECDACHLGRRMSTLCAKVDGEPYHRMGFCAVKKKRGSDDSDEDEEPLKTEFNLGRFCARRTKVYHEFSHWEYQLFYAIDREIEELRSMRKQKKGKKFYRVAYAGGKKPPEDLTDADDLCEWLDERKIIDMEWQKVKAMMESARHLEIEGKRGGGDMD